MTGTVSDRRLLSMVVRGWLFRIATVVALVALVSVAQLVVVGSARAAGPVCCQCPLPTCGPPKAGQCAPGCTPVSNATCDGKTGRCKLITAFWNGPGVGAAPASAGDGSRVPVSLQLVRASH